jgi:pantothenate kinase
MRKRFWTGELLIRTDLLSFELLIAIYRYDDKRMSQINDYFIYSIGRNIFTIHLFESNIIYTRYKRHKLFEIPVFFLSFVFHQKILLHKI